MSKAINPDLQKERTGASFPVEELTYILQGGKEITEKRRRFSKIISSNPKFSKDDNYYLSRPDRYKKGLQYTYEILKLVDEMKLSKEDFQLLYAELDEFLPISLHISMFWFCIKNMTNEQQYKKWAPLAQQFKIIGTYAQTEMGHGSNVRGLETTATFIPQTDEFEIHSPTLTSAKWWPGGLGKLSTHAAVFANLIINGKNYGVFPFMVQLRNLENHLPLKGITIGDIGPKFAFQTVDNGFLRFDKVRIPRENLFMRAIEVDRQGNFKRIAHEKFTYGSMIMMRVGFVLWSHDALAKATTIAIRYSAIRRQFPQEEDSNSERQVLDYRTQQYRLFSLLALAYALHFTYSKLNTMVAKYYKALENGESIDEILPEIHSISSGLKAYCTQATADGIEVCRLCCGGHGYSLSSGLPELYGVFVHLITAEGENHVLVQQTVRYLLKLNPNSNTESAKYLINGNQDFLQSEKCSVVSEDQFLDPEIQVKAFTHRALRAVWLVGNSLRKYHSEGQTPMQAWNSSLIEIANASRAHSILFCVQSFAEGKSRDCHDFVGVKNLSQSNTNRNIVEILSRLRNLYALYNIEKDMGDFSEDGYINADQANMIRGAVRRLLVEIRDQAVPLVDAFDVSDYRLNSVLGRRDGNAYQALWDWAQKNPLNKSQIVDGYTDYIKPLLSKGVKTNL